MYDIRLAQKSDTDAIVRYIDEHWRKDHIFVLSRELLNWQHLDTATDCLQFMIGVHKESQELHGLLGYIPLAQFDAAIEKERLIWMAIWSVRDVARGHRLGREILSTLEGVVNPDIISAVGASGMTLSMYEAKGYQVGRMCQHYILNPDITDFKLALVGDSPRGRPAKATRAGHRHLEPASKQDILDHSGRCFEWAVAPQKTPRYLVNRYLRHPLYQYQISKIQDADQTVGLIVTRTCSHDSAYAIRIVDFVGPPQALHGLYDDWIGLLRESGAEYIDFYSAGIDENDILASGFTLNREVAGTTIPSHFEPFIQKNVGMDFSINTPVGQPYRVVKGDNDCDRPNSLVQLAHE
jgi:hypothetical protein